MSYIGICEYVIGVIQDNESDLSEGIWYYAGSEDITTEYSVYKPDLADAKRYDDVDTLREELESLPKTMSYKILEIQRCPKCHKEFTEHPAISREDNETEICPECGVREAVEAYSKHQEGDIM